MPDPNIRWKHRRRHSYAALIGGLIYPLFGVAVSWMEGDPIFLGQIAPPFYMFVGVIVGAYIGFSTYDDTHGKVQTGGE